MGRSSRLGHLTGPAELILCRGGGDVDHLIDLGLELVEFQRTVIIGKGETEAVVHQSLLSGPVAVVHGPHLGQGHVALVDEHEKIVGEITHQGHGRRTRRSAADDPGIVLDAGAEAQLVHHLNVIHGALVDSLGLQQLAVFLERFFPIHHLTGNFPGGTLHFLLGGDIVAGRIDSAVGDYTLCRAGDHVEFADPVYLIPEELNADAPIGPACGEDLHGIATDPEGVADKVDVVALIADVGEAL